MSTENAKIKVRNGTVEVKWVTQYIQHIHENLAAAKPGHDADFEAIVQMLKKPDRWVHAYNRIYHVLARHKNVKYQIVLILTPKFAIVKTAYRHGYVL